MLEHPESFVGVRLRDLHVLDKLFGINTFVYALGEDGKVELVHHPTDILSKQESLDRERHANSPGLFGLVQLPGRGAIP